MNVLLVRVDGIGDALVCAPLVLALRDAGHRVGALLTTRNAEAYAGATFAAVHVVERIPWPRHGSTKESYARALSEARAARYDVALVASEEPEAYRFARASRARTRAGFVNGWEKPLKSAWTRTHLTRAVVRPASAWRSGEHEVETIFRLGDGLHAEDAPARDARRLRPLVAEPGAAREDLVVLQVARKAHADERGRALFAALAGRIARRQRTVVFADAADAELARALAAPHRLDVCLFASVAAWRARLANARAVVTADGGAAHLAGMAGVACVDVFPARPHVAYDVRRWQPWAAPSRCLVEGPDAAVTAAAADTALAELLAAPSLA